MKYSLISMLIIASVSANAADGTNHSLLEAVQNGKASLDLSVGYFDRGFDDSGKDNAEAFTAGGSAKYESASFNNFKVGLAYFGSHSLGKAKTLTKPAVLYKAYATLYKINGHHQHELGKA